jgi:hypothetical protein
LIAYRILLFLCLVDPTPLFTRSKIDFPAWDDLSKPVTIAANRWADLSVGLLF